MAPANPKPPKALLFDIGGVCVVSPFQAILDYEISKNVPPGWVNFSISRTKPNGSWHRAERGEMQLDAAFFAEFNADLRRADLWAEWVARTRKAKGESAAAPPPPLPDLDGEWLLWEIMRVSRAPDPHMAPALLKLKASGRFLMAALSNTMPLPPGFGGDSDALDVRTLFDPFVSSAHTGVRKPERRAYELAMKLMRERYAGGDGLEPSDVVFLDDIGENLKAGRQMGFRTIKVTLGNTREAVKELEQVTGMKLLEDDDGGSSSSGGGKTSSKL